MTEGGFTYVDVARSKPRVFTNSTIKAAQQQQKRESQTKTVSSSGAKHGSVFVSNFTLDTKPEHIDSHLYKKFGCRFKVIRVPSKVKDCASFKVVVESDMMTKVLNKINWSPNVYVREFYENARKLVSLAN